MIISRGQYLNKIISHKDNGLVKVITGLRRSGKTYLLKVLFKDWLIEQGIAEKNIIYLPLDLNENAKYRNPILLDQYLREKIQVTDGRCYVMIDEIQYSVSVPNTWLPEEAQTPENSITFYDTVLGLMDFCDLYITGSNSEMLSSDILTNFRGRGDEIPVYPLSFSEFLPACGRPRAEAFREYLYYGGMPFVLSCESPRDKSAYLKTLFDKTYDEDLISRYKIQNRDDLGRILDMLASSVGSLVNPTNIANKFGNTIKLSVTRNTVAEYIDHIKNAFLIDEAKRFDIRGKEYISGQQKYYFTDLGLRNARLNFRQYDLPHLLENAVYNELRIRGFSVDVGRVQTRIKNKNGDYQISYLESDFVVNDADRKMYIQVAEGIDDPEKKEQEMKSLLHIRDGFPKIILVNQDIPKHHSEEGFVIMSIIDFLLGNDSL